MLKTLDFRKYFDEEFMERMIPLKELGTLDVAWSREDALKIIETLKDVNVVIAGGDVIERKNDNLEYTYDSWSLDEEEEQSGENRVKMSKLKAVEYIKNYPEVADREIFFVLVFSSNVIFSEKHQIFIYPDEEYGSFWLPPGCYFPAWKDQSNQDRNS